MVTQEERWAIDEKVPLPKVTDGLQTGCAVCGKTGFIKLCICCRVVGYCSPEHQSAHYQNHRYLCHAIKNELVKFANAEAHAQMIQAGPYSEKARVPSERLQDEEGDKLFATYKESPLHVYLRRVNTVQAVYKAQEYFQRCAYLTWPREPLEFQVASLEASARLGQDQNLYDLIKWICVFKMGTGPACNFVNSNVFEPIDFMIEPRGTIWYPRITSLLVLMAWFKVKILLDLTRLEKARALLSHFPPQVRTRTLMGVPSSLTISGNRAIMTKPDISTEIATLKNQIKILVSEAKDRNKYFWRKLALHNPAERLVEKFNKYELADPELGQAKDMVLFHAYYWFETPGAIPMLHQLGLL